jgi:peptide/nickel transport system substrate-binding protein
MKASRVFGALLLILAASFVIAACGSSSSSDSGGGGKAKGGSITIGTVGPDSYDPALLQTIQASQATIPAYTSLLAYKHVTGKDGATLVPGIAKSLPKVSNGGKTYEFTIPTDLKYSDGTPLKASDFQHTMKRVVALKGPYSSFYTGIVGALDFQNKGDNSKSIPGIVTDDAKGTIKVTLEKPDGKFPFAVGQVWAALLSPKTSTFKGMSENPPPGYGPYILKVQDPSRHFTLTKNPNFKPLPNVPAGHVDKITGLVSTNVPKMTQDVIKGKLDFMTEDPTGDLLPQVRQRYSDRFRQDANPPNTYYFFLNVTIPPFNQQKAREAVNYGIDSRALVRIFGGRLQPGCTFLPPALPGYKKNDCKWGDPAGPGNIAKAKQLVKESGTAGQTVTVWTNTKDPRPAIGQYYADMLSQIGYKSKIKTLDQQVYFDKVGTQATKAQTGFTDWFQDFPHPADFFQPLLSKESLQSTPTSNQGRVDDPSLNKQITDLTSAPKLDSATASKWGDLDNYIVNDKAYIVPYGYEESTSFFSPRMNFKDCSGVHPVYKNDWTQFCLKK